MKPLLGALLLGALAAPSVSAQASAPTPRGDWRGQIVYQVMPDRFFDGDPANNAGVDKADPRGWHGGDLAGLTKKLDYVRSLGATAVWLTPVYRQVEGRNGGATGYHGYWPEDFRDVDPHFGTLADFDAFVKAARGAGMRVILDQVVNHYGYGASALRERPAWFHDEATCANLGNRDVFCPLFGLPDLATEKPEVAAFLKENADFWRARGVDGFRHDAIKHVGEDFLRRMLATDRAAGTWTLGEYYDADPDIIGRYQTLGFDSLFDFSLQAAMKDSVMGGQSLDRVRTVLRAQARAKDPDNIALFLDNHDVPRFANGSPFEDVARERTAYGLRALLTLRGVPVIWQGTEIALRGGADPDNRRDMRFEDAWTPEERAVWTAAQSAIRARKASVALSRGDQTLLDVPAALGDDLLLFTRAAGNEKVLVAWHAGRARRTVSLKLGLNARAARDLLGQNAGMSVSNGFVHLSLPPRTAVAFRLQ